MKATSQTMKSVTVSIDGIAPVVMGLKHRPELREGYYEIALDEIPVGPTYSGEEWAMIVEIIEYSINEGEDMQRTVEAGECHPAFSFRIN